VEGVEGDGLGEQLAIPLSTQRATRSLHVELRNGYQKSPALLAANAAPSRLRLEATFEGQVVAGAEFELARQEGWQSFDLPLDGRSAVDGLRLTILAVHPGSRYKDTCISDLRVSAQSATTYVPAVEEARLKRLQAWAAERKGAAEWYASRPPTWPWAGTQLEWVDMPDPKVAEAARELEAQRPDVAALKAQPARYRPAVQSRERLPEGLKSAVPLLAVVPVRAEQLSWFESKDHKGLSRDVSDPEWDGSYELHLSAAQLRWWEQPGSRPREAWMGLTQVEHGRSTHTSRGELVLRWDEKGQLTQIWQRTKGGSECWEGEVESLLSLSWSSGGQIQRLDELRLHKGQDSCTDVPRPNNFASRERRELRPNP
jgi:hypothetical protein